MTLKKYCEGPPDAKIAIVGEAPGETEEATGRPFVGAAGRLLNELLAIAQIPRSSCYLTNVLKLRPPKNIITSFIDFRGGKAITSEAYNQHEEHLYEELREINPNVIIALGAVPLWALTRQQLITKRRGSMYMSNIGIKVIPTIHPAAALREYMMRYYIMHDFHRAKEQAEFPELRLPQRELILYPTVMDIYEYLEKIKQRHAVAFDIEVYHDEVSHISFAVDPNDAICIPFISKGHDYFDPGTEIEVWKAINAVLNNPSIVKIAHNAIFDVGFLYKHLGIHVQNIEDTMILQRVNNPEFRMGLDTVTSLYTEEPYYKDEGKIHRKFGGEEEAFHRYSALDSAVAMEAFPKMLSECEAAGNLQTYNDMKAMIPPLLEMSLRGIAVDHDRRGKVIAENRARQAELQAELDKLCGEHLNINSPKQVQTYFYIKKRLKPYTKKGKITTDEDALIRLASHGHREAKIIMELRHLSKMLSSYLDLKFSSDGRLRGTYNPAGSGSGRISSSAAIDGTGCNMQTLPEEIRDMLIADDNCVIFNVDLARAENMCVAYFGPEPAMMEAFEKGHDLHKLTASLIYGVPVEEITSAQRQMGKRANHALNYGMSWQKFMLDNMVSKEEAMLVYTAYHSGYPGVQRYWQWIRQELSSKRKLTGVYGWKRPFLDRWGDDLFKEAYSFMPQNAVAHKMNQQGVRYLYAHYPRQVKLLNTMHDSVSFEVNRIYGWKFIAEILFDLKRSLETPVPWKRPFVIKADFSMGLNLAKHSKTNPQGQRTVNMEIENLPLHLEQLYWEAANAEEAQ